MNLLLEGDDPEELLSRARKEAGPHARIVRAEKVRRGGVLGFFAKEGYEVAVEVPDAGDAESAAGPGRQPVAGTESPEESAHRRAAVAAANAAAARTSVAFRGDEGDDRLLGLADRVSAAERAASAALAAETALDPAIDGPIRRDRAAADAQAMAEAAAAARFIADLVSNPDLSAPAPVTRSADDERAAALSQALAGLGFPRAVPAAHVEADPWVNDDWRPELPQRSAPEEEPEEPAVPSFVLDRLPPELDLEAYDESDPATGGWTELSAPARQQPSAALPAPWLTGPPEPGPLPDPEPWTDPEPLPGPAAWTDPEPAAEPDAFPRPESFPQPQSHPEPAALPEPTAVEPGPLPDPEAWADPLSSAEPAPTELPHAEPPAGAEPHAWAEPEHAPGLGTLPEPLLPPEPEPVRPSGPGEQDVLRWMGYGVPHHPAHAAAPAAEPAAVHQPPEPLGPPTAHLANPLTDPLTPPPGDPAGHRTDGATAALTSGLTEEPAEDAWTAADPAPPVGPPGPEFDPEPAGNRAVTALEDPAFREPVVHEPLPGEPGWGPSPHEPLWDELHAAHPPGRDDPPAGVARPEEGTVVHDPVLGDLVLHDEPASAPEVPEPADEPIEENTVGRHRPDHPRHPSEDPDLIPVDILPAGSRGIRQDDENHRPEPEFHGFVEPVSPVEARAWAAVLHAEPPAETAAEEEWRPDEGPVLVGHPGGHHGGHEPLDETEAVPYEFPRVETPHDEHDEHEELDVQDDDDIGELRADAPGGVPRATTIVPESRRARAARGAGVPAPRTPTEEPAEAPAAQASWQMLRNLRAGRRPFTRREPEPVTAGAPAPGAVAFANGTDASGAVHVDGWDHSDPAHQAVAVAEQALAPDGYGHEPVEPAPEPPAGSPAADPYAYGQYASGHYLDEQPPKDPVQAQYAAYPAEPEYAEDEGGYPADYADATFHIPAQTRSEDRFATAYAGPAAEHGREHAREQAIEPAPVPSVPLEVPGLAEALRPAAPRAHGVITGSRLEADRQTLAELGVPVGWVPMLHEGDRFGAVFDVLEPMPEPDIDPHAQVVVVVGPADVVELEAHRTALDLPIGNRPRTVVTVPLHESEERHHALVSARNVRPVAIAIETGGDDLEPGTRALLENLRPDVVIAVVDATRPIAETARRLRSLGRVDAIAVDGALDVDDPAATLVLDVPVIRIDGVPVDRFGWAALLCAHLVARDGE